MRNESPSYQTGFAPRDGQPLYPELWHGCVGAWAPCLGPSGLTLRDWSGFGNHGALTSGPTWQASQGKYAINFDGSDDYVSAIGPTLLSAMTVTAWVRTTSTASQNIVTRRITAGTDYLNYVFAIDSTKLLFAFTALANNYHVWASTSTASVLGVTDGRWHLLSAGFLFGAGSSIAIRIDGNLPVAGSWTIGNGNAMHTNNPAELFVIGKELYSPSNYWSGHMDDIRLYNRELCPHEHRLLASRRCIAYELAPRRRSSAAVAGFNPSWVRRRSLVIGGGIN